MDSRIKFGNGEKRAWKVRAAAGRQDPHHEPCNRGSRAGTGV